VGKSCSEAFHLERGETAAFDMAPDPGAFLSLGAGLEAGPRFWLLTIGTGLLLISVVVVLVRRVDLRWSSFLALTLIVAGGAGNLWDRVAQGFVVDFVSLGLGPLRTGISNVADLAITAGAAWLVLAGGRRRGEPQTPAQPSSP
jgi:signal peptidase II